MPDPNDVADTSLEEVRRTRAAIKRGRSSQVRSAEERGLMKATALSWFRNHRAHLATLDVALLEPVDLCFRELLAGSDRAMRRQACSDLLKRTSSALSELRSYTLVPVGTRAKTTDAPPDFSTLIADVAMREILGRRWQECTACIAAAAPLAATVMMGGLLEALLLARVNAETDKKSVFQTCTAPKDKSSGRTLPLQEWTLRHFIDVAHELKWISASGKDIGVVLRDYRNYVHPYKELAHGITLQARDAALFWEVVKNLSKQLLV
jgi:hypothetical protein